MNSDPTIMTRSLATRATAEFRDRHARALRAAMDRVKRDPAKVERMRQSGRNFGAPALRRMTTEQKSAAARKMHERRRAWCAAEFREMDDDLRRVGFSLAERKKLIAQHALDVARREIFAREAAAHARQARERAQAY